MTKHRQLWPLFVALVAGAAHYCYLFFYAGGSHRVGWDSYYYNLMAAGGQVGSPYNLRVVVPWLAGHLAALFNTDTLTAFRLTTPLCLLAALCALWLLLQRAAVPLFPQAVLLLGVALQIARYGGQPILTDPLLLLLACLIALCLQSERALLALPLVCLAALTKEYGILLLLPWAACAYPLRRSLLWLLLLPLAVWLGMRGTPQGVDTQGDFLRYALTYNLQPFYDLGVLRAAQALLLTLWTALWPIYLLAAVGVFRAWRAGTMSTFTRCCAALLLALPISFCGDLERSVVLFLPFALVVAGTVSLANARTLYTALLVGFVAVGYAHTGTGISALPFVLRAAFHFGLAALSLYVSIQALGLPRKRAVTSSEPRLAQAS